VGPPETRKRGDSKLKAAGMIADVLDKVGLSTDESTGKDNEIFGVDIDDLDEMDRLMMPPDVNLMEEHMAIYDCAVDVGSLPGTSSNGGGEDIGASDMNDLAVAIKDVMSDGKMARRHLVYHRATQNGLAKIKDKTSLLDFKIDLEKAMKAERKVQKSGLARTLYSIGYSKTSVNVYQKVSPLFLVVETTFRNMLSLINTLVSYSTRGDSTSWKGTYPHQMLEYHSKELLGIRTRATSYRHLVLQNYTYLRDAKDASFYHNSMNKYLWFQVAGKLEGNSFPMATPPTTSPSDNEHIWCSRCNKQDLHPGGKTQCNINSRLTDSEARKLVTGLVIRTARKVANSAKTILDANPDKDHADVIKEAREHASG
jgi:hypothetical protein